MLAIFQLFIKKKNTSGEKKNIAVFNLIMAHVAAGVAINKIAEWKSSSATRMDTFKVFFK